MSPGHLLTALLPFVSLLRWWNMASYVLYLSPGHDHSLPTFSSDLFNHKSHWDHRNKLQTLAHVSSNPRSSTCTLGNAGFLLLDFRHRASMSASSPNLCSLPVTSLAIFAFLVTDAAHQDPPLGNIATVAEPGPLGEGGENRLG